MARALLKRTAALVASTVLALALAWAGGEAYLRWRFPPSYSPDPGLAADRYLGWNSVPPVTALPLNLAPHAGVANGRPMIYFVGDSFTDRKSWPATAQLLMAEQGLAVDGFNLGVSGYGTTQESLKLEQQLKERPAQAVVVLFFAFNDLRDNYPYPELYYGPQRATRPYLLVKGDEASLSPVQWSSQLRSELLRSEFYLQVVTRIQGKVDAAIVRRWPDLASSLGWRAQVYYEDPAGWSPFYRADQADTAYVIGAYDSTRAAFQRIKALVEPTGAKLLVIGIDSAFTVDADVAGHFITPHPELDPSLPLKRIGSLLLNEGIEFIDAQPELAALAKQSGKPIYDGPRDGLGGHLQPQGYDAIGAIAARWLEKELPRHH